MSKALFCARCSGSLGLLTSAAGGITFASIDGTMAADVVEDRLAEWKARKTTVLLGKPVMLGVGLNLQQANKMIFVGIVGGAFMGVLGSLVSVGRHLRRI